VHKEWLFYDFVWEVPYIEDHPSSNPQEIHFAT